MTRGSLGLVEVPTAELKTLLAAVHKGDVTCPIDVVALARLGLQDLSAPLLGTLRGLDEPAVRAVLTAVLAERMRRP